MGFGDIINSLCGIFAHDLTYGEHVPCQGLPCPQKIVQNTTLYGGVDAGENGDIIWNGFIDMYQTLYPDYVKCFVDEGETITTLRGRQLTIMKKAVVMIPCGTRILSRSNDKMVLCSNYGGVVYGDPDDDESNGVFLLRGTTVSGADGVPYRISDDVPILLEYDEGTTPFIVVKNSKVAMNMGETSMKLCDDMYAYIDMRNS